MWLLLLLAFVLGTAAQDVKWSPRTFPNPGVNVTRCGRGGLVSRVCDPDRLLSKTAADSVDGILKDVVLPVQPYAAAPCSWLEPGRQGFQVMPEPECCVFRDCDSSCCCALRFVPSPVLLSAARCESTRAVREQRLRPCDSLHQCPYQTLSSGLTRPSRLLTTEGWRVDRWGWQS